MTCCDGVELTSTDQAFLSSGYSIFQGIYTRFNDTPTFEHRNVYQLVSAPTYCLYYSHGAWRVNNCKDVGKGSYYMKATTANDCPHGGNMVWQWSEYTDDTMEIICNPGRLCNYFKGIYASEVTTSFT